MSEGPADESKGIKSKLGKFGKAAVKAKAMDAVSKTTKPMADAAKDKVAQVAEGVKKNIEDKASELVKDQAKKQMKKKFFGK